MNIDFSVLKGKTIRNIVRLEEQIVFIIDDNEKYLMYHEQNCCEIVYIKDIAGEIDWLIGAPVLVAEERSNCFGAQDLDESCTWTFYEIATLQGAVTITWYGESNGYYSESVDFKRV